MKKNIFIWIIFFSGILISDLYSQIYVTLPNVLGSPGTEKTAPLKVSDLTGLDVSSFQFRIYYDKNVVYLTGTEHNGTLTDGKSAMYKADTANGSLNVAWADAYPLKGSGVLLNIKFRFRRYGVSNLTTVGPTGETCLFNGGNPAAVVINGTSTTAVEPGKEKRDLPESFCLEQNYPNPFNPSTKISYSIAKESKVSLKVYNLIGQEVETIVEKVQPAGSYSVNFNAGHLPSGLYIYRLKAGENTEVRKMTLTK
ncbi:MAG: T9SS type A sorting domain-containing protein [Bacillota bacterium]